VDATTEFSLVMAVPAFLSVLFVDASYIDVKLGREIVWSIKPIVINVKRVA
jgi:hypothetical protein